LVRVVQVAHIKTTAVLEMIVYFQQSLQREVVMQLNTTMEVKPLVQVVQAVVQEL